MLRSLVRTIVGFFTFLVFIVTSAGAGIFFLFFYYGRDLPDYSHLESYEPWVISRLYTHGGEMFYEYAIERRIFMPLSKIPPLLLQAFLVAEDKNFFNHPGIDIIGMIRAAVVNTLTQRWQDHPLGASTITQQVAKNFLIGAEHSFSRKFKEVIMALRLERSLSKERILELYVNEIFLGARSYGVAAAAYTYFNKSLDELELEEMAFLASLPKAPAAYHPHKAPARAKARRNWVIDRLAEEGVISKEEAARVKEKPLLLRPPPPQKLKAPYFAEDIRRALIPFFGEEAFYRKGLTIQTTLVPSLQKNAEEALREGLIAYDRRHGWRGPFAKVTERGREILEEMPLPAGLGNWQLAVVEEVQPDRASIWLRGGGKGEILLSSLTWARAWQPGETVGPEIKSVHDVLSKGDIIAVSRQEDGVYQLEQIPAVTGGIVVMDPFSGAVKAMSGGYHHDLHQFNCATQAFRQPGSAFKPFVYLTALLKGMSPETKIHDAPVSFRAGKDIYSPKNITGRYYGWTPLHEALAYSRNVVTVILAQKVGMKNVAKTARLFGIMDHVPNQLAIALGAGETTLLKLTAAYAMIANGGYRVVPTLIKKIEDQKGNVLYTHKPQEFYRKLVDGQALGYLQQMLREVVQYGTAKRLNARSVPIWGKTGTTNDYKDAWFIGYTEDMVVGVFIGFPTPRTLGPRETGGRVALPVFESFIKKTYEKEGRAQQASFKLTP